MVTDLSEIHAHPTHLPRRIPKAEFVAGRLSLAFCNSVALPDAADRLADPVGLAAWAERAGHALGRIPDAADHADMLALRATLCAIFTDLVAGIDPPATALASLGAAMVPVRLVWDGSTRRAHTLAAGDALSELKRAIISDAIELLTGEAQARIKRCPGADCRWFFFDTTKNAQRRWCAMGDCGVKAKVARYRTRHAAF